MLDPVRMGFSLEPSEQETEAVITAIEAAIEEDPSPPSTAPQPPPSLAAPPPASPRRKHFPRIRLPTDIVHKLCAMSGIPPPQMRPSIK